MITYVTETQKDERFTRAGLPKPEFRCNHWGHEVGIINDQQCQRLVKEGERYCGRHLVAVKRRRAIAVATRPIDPEVKARLIAELEGN